MLSVPFSSGFALRLNFYANVTDYKIITFSSLFLGIRFATKMREEVVWRYLAFSSLFLGIRFATKDFSTVRTTSSTFSSLFLGIRFATDREWCAERIDNNAFSSLFLGIRFATLPSTRPADSAKQLSVPFSSGFALRHFRQRSRRNTHI